MTLEEMITSLREDLDSENSDYDKYMKLAESMDEKFPKRGYGGILRDIAKEEMTHQLHIKYMLKDMGADEEENKEEDEKTNTKVK